MRKKTIKDVAKEANVSIATVSRILNQTSKGYSEKTKKHVLETMERMGYSPNAVARSLISRQTGTIGVLFPEISGMVSSEMLHGIEAVANTFGHSVIVCNTNSDQAKTLKYLRLLEEKQVEGVIFTSKILSETYGKMVGQMNVPFVVLASESEVEGVPHIKVDDELASYEATKFLIEHGHKHIGMLSGNGDDPIAGKPRIDGFKRALKEAKLLCRHTQVAQNNGFYFENGHLAFSKLMASHPETTAVFASSDELAMSAISAALEYGKRVPDDLSIIGYDNTKLAKMAVPKLTVVSQELESLGRKATEMLYREIHTGEKSPSVTAQHNIVKRDSVKTLST
ncbi:LacI family DNA-binding transcriptional regulator [Bacillus sp. H-16]|uniref:LacI family DNA-binding transcriptional regulator n=1 Tax=Alteribacter salitolerans TaxID=2912333 RepID=UPI0019643986|nr:LacI family DNA-binding transcriptional regulator [Alteribacter salitolerans]MBM7094822.1 LacI family DNA-binding transcriptional regulator [Alteribacter salitolerans]